MAPTQTNDYWPRFWAYYKEAASYAAFTMPDPSKTGDFAKIGVESIVAFVAAAEASKQTGILSMQRIFYHMAARGQYKQIETLTRLFGWVMRVNNAGATATRGVLSNGLRTLGTSASGTAVLGGEITVTIPGIAATAAGAVVAAYVGTMIGCLGYAQLRMMGAMDPESGYLGQMFAQFYGYDPQTEATTDFLAAKAKAKSAAVRRAAQLDAVIPQKLLQAY